MLFFRSKYSRKTLLNIHASYINLVLRIDAIVYEDHGPDVDVAAVTVIDPGEASYSFCVRETPSAVLADSTACLPSSATPVAAL